MIVVCALFKNKLCMFACVCFAALFFLCVLCLCSCLFY